MHFKILTSVSVVALLFGIQVAIAQVNTTVDTGTRASVTTQEDKSFVDNMKDTLNKTKDSITGTSDKVTYTLFGNDENDRGTEVVIDARATADGMLGTPVNNTTGERIGTLKDIILDDKGEAVLAVVSDAEFVDLGAKEAAFDYSLVTQSSTDGDVVMPLTEETLKNAKAFSYEMNTENNAEIRTIPENGYSVEKLMDAEILGPDNTSVGSVDNIIFRAGRADTVIVGFDKTLNMGGKKAALSFQDLQLVKKNETDVNFQLTASQAAKFETFKEGVSN
ncbi:MAG: PRC-barrel domain-containing protein [Micavibrio sp.]